MEWWTEDEKQIYVTWSFWLWLVSIYSHETTSHEIKHCQCQLVVESNNTKLLQNIILFHMLQFLIPWVVNVRSITKSFWRIGNFASLACSLNICFSQRVQLQRVLSLCALCASYLIWIEGLQKTSDRPCLWTKLGLRPSFKALMTMALERIWIEDIFENIQ